METTINRSPTQLVKYAQAIIDPDHVIVSYDYETDSLIFHLFGRGIPSVNVLVTDEFMIRVDRRNDRIVGFQFDRFLTMVTVEHPELIDILDIAELRGITAEEIGRLRRERAMTRRNVVIDRAIANVDTIAKAAD